MIPKIFLYCWWILAWTILFLFNITDISPFFSSLIGTIVSFYIHFIGKHSDVFNFNIKVFIIIVEIIILSLIIYFTNFSNSLRDIKYNLIIFLIYLFVLFINNKSFYQIYFIDLVNQAKKHFSTKKYLKKRIPFLFNND
tara:strand:+ start:2085 stop:2501 length:417 start_codon:yes stop_codon:yes gene_type:complete